MGDKTIPDSTEPILFPILLRCRSTISWCTGSVAYHLVFHGANFRYLLIFLNLVAERQHRDWRKGRGKFWSALTSIAKQWICFTIWTKSYFPVRIAVIRIRMLCLNGFTAMCPRILTYKMVLEHDVVGQKYITPNMWTKCYGASEHCYEARMT